MARELADMYPTQGICEARGLRRNTCYCQAQARDQQNVKAAIEEVALQ